MDFSNAGTTTALAGDASRAHVQWNDKGAKRNIYGPNRKDQVAAKEDLESMRAAAVTGGPPLPPVLSLYPFGIKEGPNGTSLPMYPSVGFAFQARLGRPRAAPGTYPFFIFS